MSPSEGGEITTLQAEKFPAIRRRMAADGHRPRYHFLPPANWMNDPNGLIQWRGRYHLFYQHNPYGAYWGYMHWGHAVSDDLIHWSDRPIALAPEPGTPWSDGYWTGCAVDDDGVPTLVFTKREEGRELVCLATSRDEELLSWQEAPENPVIDAPPAGMNVVGFRDPYVWREGDAWYMVIGTGIVDVGGAALLYSSPDLRRWEYLGPLLVGEAARHGTMWECPNFFPLGEKHVLIVSIWKQDHVRYFVGTYADRRFTPEREGVIDGGFRLFAPQVMRDDRGRRLMFGWVMEGRAEAACREAGWAGVMSLPRVLSLSSDGTLATAPAPEIRALRGEHFHLGASPITPGAERVMPISGDCLEIAAEFESGEGTLGLKLRCAPDGSEQTIIGYDGTTGRLFLDGRRTSLSPDAQGDYYEMPFSPPDDEPVRLHIFLDRSIVEVFGNDRVCLTGRVYPERADSQEVRVFAEGEGAQLRSLDIWRMQAIWPDGS
ncbi:MAG: glycoside hydrolase family 32 protein [Chloroflexi bacterium]|nr:glycoside hydrolase family 32 protein [Chloroflexota bacterium]